MKVKKMFPENEPTERTENHTGEPVKQGLFTQISQWLQSKFGTTPVQEPPQQQPVEVVYRYKVQIYTGAGVIKIGVDAANKKEAEQMALVDYVKRLNVKAELIG